jgi:glutamate carboxypeptidase
MSSPRARPLWAGLLVFALATSIATAEERNHALLRAATEAQPQMVEMLGALAAIDAQSDHALGASASAMRERIRAEFKKDGFSDALEGASEPARLMFSLVGHGEIRVLLLTGDGNERPFPARTSFRVEDGKIHVPSLVADLGSEVMILHTLRMLRATGFERFRKISVLSSPPDGRCDALTMQAVRNADYVLSFDDVWNRSEELALSYPGRAFVGLQARVVHGDGEPRTSKEIMEVLQGRIARSIGRFQGTRPGEGGGGSGANQAEAFAMFSYAKKRDLDRVFGAIASDANALKRSGLNVQLRLENRALPFRADSKSRQLALDGASFYREAGGSIEIKPTSLYGSATAACAAQWGKPVLGGLGLPGGVEGDTLDVVGERYVTLDAISRRLYMAARLIMNIGQGHRT